jgi:hypothetical protein
MDVSDNVLAAQARYARWLTWGTRVGLAILTLGFAAYVTGVVALHVPIERLPALWDRPSGEVLLQTGIRAGWGWTEFIHRSDMLVLAGIALLASCSIACLAAVIPVFRARGERIYVGICIVQIAVLVVAASGLLAATAR